jgi:hypothetical protein
MLRKRIVGGRAPLLGCTLLIAVACGTDPVERSQDFALDPGGPAPVDSTSSTAGAGGRSTAASGTRNEAAHDNTADTDGVSPEEESPQVLQLGECDPTAPFDAPVAAFTGTMNADGLTFSGDGLTAYISGYGAGGYEIFRATRSSTTAPFNTPSLVLQGSAWERAPSLAPDDLALYFTMNSVGDIAKALWSNATGQFGTPQVFSSPINTGVSDQDPYWWRSQQVLLFASERPSGEHREIYYMNWDGSAFSAPTKIEGADINSNYEDFRPVITENGRTLFFASKRPGIGNDTGGDVLVTTRAATNQAFPPAANLWTVNSSGNEFPVYVTPDGCTLYFASNEETGFGSTENYRLYQATRPVSAPSQVTVTLDVVGQGNVVYGSLNCGAGTPGACTASGPPNTPFTVTASGHATWIGSCTANGGQPSTDGVIVLAQNGVCTVTFATPTPSGIGGACTTSINCAQGLQCTDGTCTCMPGALGAECRDPVETVELRIPVPRNIGLSKFLLVGTEALTLGPGIRIEAGADPLVGVAGLGSGGVSLGASTEVDSVVSYGPVTVGENARVRGYIGGAQQLSVHPSAFVWGEETGLRAPLESGTLRESFGTTTSDVVVSGGHTAVLAPGRYRNVQVDSGILKLETGRYTLDRLSVGPAGIVEYDSRDGEPYVAVRTAMTFQGLGRDRAVVAGLPAFGAPTFAYMGGDALTFGGAPPGRVFAAGARVTVLLPPGSGTPTIWGVIGRIVDVIGDPNGTIIRPGSRSVIPPNIDIPPPAASISVNGYYEFVAGASTQADPITIHSDNPWLHGSFAWKLPNQSASGGCRPWFDGGTWQGVHASTLTLWRLRPNLAPAQAWSAALLPGFYFGFANPPCSFNSDTYPRAYFTTRAFNLWHGATFRALPTIDHTDTIHATPAEDVFVKLSNDVAVVPVVVIHWDGPSFLDRVGALFDFIPSREYPPNIAPPLRPPPAPFASPAAMDFPPDEIWKQCGIQFQIVRALHIGEPDPLPRFSGGSGCPPDANGQPRSPCSCNPNTTAAGMPDYARNETLSARLHEALGSEFDSIFGQGGLAPLLVQYGRPSGGSCNEQGGYRGKAIEGAQILGDVHVTGIVQISAAGSNTTAHEIGHALGLDHVSDPELLMYDFPTLNSDTITPSQCETARSAALALSRAYFNYNQRRGQTDPFTFEPAAGSRFPAAVSAGSISDEVQMVCCDVGGGQKVETLAALCLSPRGQAVADCSVCCNDGGNFDRVDNDQCDTADVVPLGQCTVACCELGNREEQLPVGECENLDGEPCVLVCCRGTDNIDRDLNRGVCQRSGGTERYTGSCNNEPR